MKELEKKVAMMVYLWLTEPIGDPTEDAHRLAAAILALPEIANAQAEIERLKKTLDWISGSACEDLGVAKMAAKKVLEATHD